MERRTLVTLCQHTCFFPFVVLFFLKLLNWIVELRHGGDVWFRRLLVCRDTWMLCASSQLKRRKGEGSRRSDSTSSSSEKKPHTRVGRENVPVRSSWRSRRADIRLLNVRQSKGRRGTAPVSLARTIAMSELCSHETEWSVQFNQ